MLLEGIKKAFDKFKYRFKGIDDKANMVEDREGLDYLPKQEEVIKVDVVPGDKLTVRVKVNITEFRRAAKAMYTYLEIVRLTKILIKTRKPRVKRKLAKRIAKLRNCEKSGQLYMDNTVL